MQTEKERILQMVSEGKLAVEEAITLLEALEKTTAEQTPAADKQTKQSQTKEEPTFERIFEEDLKTFRKDMTQIGSVFMDLFNKTVDKVKDMDMSTPFPLGEKVSFQDVKTLDGDDVRQVYVDLPNGSLTIEPAELNDIRIVTSVRTPLDNDVETTKQRFLSNYVVDTQQQSLRIITDAKWSQIEVTLYLPRKKYDELKLRFVNGGVSLHDVEAGKLRVKSLNGAVKAHDVRFADAEIKTSNGAIELRDVRGKEIEAETLNGRIYIDGAVEEVEAKSINGAIAVTTYAKNARKVEAETVAGTVEVYVPSHVALSGKLATNMGKLDVNLADVDQVASQDQLFSKTLHFTKHVENAHKLFIEGTSKTGTILVRYTTIVDTE